MEQEQLENIEVTNTNTAEDYLRVINDMKKSTVSADAYNKLREENRQLLEQIVNNTYEMQKEDDSEPQMRPSADIRDELFNTSKSLTNLDFINLSLELRDAVLAETGDDIFTVHKNGQFPSEEALASAQRTADVFAQCVEGCNGDPTMFNALLQQRMQDTGRIGRR